MRRGGENQSGGGFNPNARVFCPGATAHNQSSSMLVYHPQSTVVYSGVMPNNPVFVATQQNSGVSSVTGVTYPVINNFAPAGYVTQEIIGLAVNAPYPTQHQGGLGVAQAERISQSSSLSSSAKEFTPGVCFAAAESKALGPVNTLRNVNASIAQPGRDDGTRGGERKSRPNTSQFFSPQENSQLQSLSSMSGDNSTVPAGRSSKRNVVAATQQLSAAQVGVVAGLGALQTASNNIQMVQQQLYCVRIQPGAYYGGEIPPCKVIFHPPGRLARDGFPEIAPTTKSQLHLTASRRGNMLVYYRIEGSTKEKYIIGLNNSFLSENDFSRLVRLCFEQGRNFDNVALTAVHNLIKYTYQMGHTRPHYPETSKYILFGYQSIEDFEEDCRILDEAYKNSNPDGSASLFVKKPTPYLISFESYPEFYRHGANIISRWHESTVNKVRALPQFRQDIAAKFFTSKRAVPVNPLSQQFNNPGMQRGGFFQQQQAQFAAQQHPDMRQLAAHRNWGPR